MRKVLSLTVVGGAVLVTSSLFAQVVNPDVTGPVRRAAGTAADAAGAPGVNARIENREQRRDVIRAEAGNPNAAARADIRANDQWRYKYHNNRWWYYTPQNQWMHYSNNAWQNYAAPPYTTGYRGTDGYYNNNNNGYYYRRGLFRRGNYNGGGYGAATTPYSNGTRAGNFGSNLGAEIGGAVNGPAVAQTGAAIGADIGNPIGATNNNVGGAPHVGASEHVGASAPAAPPIGNPDSTPLNPNR